MRAADESGSDGGRQWTRSQVDPGRTLCDGGDQAWGRSRPGVDALGGGAFQRGKGQPEPARRRSWRPRMPFTQADPVPDGTMRPGRAGEPSALAWGSTMLMAPDGSAEMGPRGSMGLDLVFEQSHAAGDRAAGQQGIAGHGGIARPAATAGRSGDGQAQRSARQGGPPPASGGADGHPRARHPGRAPSGRGRHRRASRRSIISRCPNSAAQASSSSSRAWAAAAGVRSGRSAVA